MRKKMFFGVILAVILCPSLAWAQGTGAGDAEPFTNPAWSVLARTQSPSPDAGVLVAPFVSRTFYEIAYELAHSKDAALPDLEQAVVLLNAAMKLDNNPKGVRPLLIEVACRLPGPDYSSMVYNVLVDYVDEFADLQVVDEAVEHLLGLLNSREERERLLEQMIGTLGSKNTILSSELAGKLGLLKAEKADVEAARVYLLQAYKNNRYNKAAFAKLLELSPQDISPATYLERLRLALRENPADMDTAIAFAEYAEQLQLYDVAAAAYGYCVDLFGYLYPSGALPARIYLPWAISSYNSRKGISKCMDIAKRIRERGTFDVRLEAIVGKAAVKLGDIELATRTFQAVEERTTQLLMLESIKRSNDTPPTSGDSSQKVHPDQLAWFYCLALPIADRALDWANKAYKADPNSPITAAILAYALVMNKQTEPVKPLLTNYPPNQISQVTLAQVQLAQGQTDLAIETLNSAIARDPGSFAAERAKEILAQQGQPYVPPVDPQAVLASLARVFGDALVPAFTAPEQAVSPKLDLQGDTFAYGSEFSGIAAITNNSSEPLVISDDGLFKGNIRIDAKIGGDLDVNVPSLVFTRTRTAFLGEPGRSILIPVRLMTGKLRETLLTYPQASLEIEFRLYLDPVVTKEGEIANRLTRIRPAVARVKRPGIELTTRYLQQRFNSISQPGQVQKIEAATLFTGLLKEQHAFSGGRPLYRFMYDDRMAPLLRSALLHEAGLLRNPAENDWPVKVHTMAQMLSLPLDHPLVSAVAENLNNAKWPVRMMAIYLLDKSQQGQFDQVLQWIMKNDPNQLVRQMAAALQGAVGG